MVVRGASEHPRAATKKKAPIREPFWGAHGLDGVDRASKAATNLCTIVGLYRAMAKTDDPTKIRVLEAAVRRIVPDLMLEEVAFMRAMARNDPE